METLEQMVRNLRGKVSKIAIHYFPDKELIIHLDGKKLHSNDCSIQMFEKMRDAREKKNVTGIYNLIYGQETYENPLDVYMSRVHAICFLVDTGDFDVKGNSVFLEGVEHAIPEPLIDEWVSLIKKYKWQKEVFNNSEECLTLKNFWVWVKNIHVTTGNKELFEDSFIQGLLEGYHKDHKFFNKCLESKELEVKMSKEKEKEFVFDVKALQQRIAEIQTTAVQ